MGIESGVRLIVSDLDRAVHSLREHEELMARARDAISALQSKLYERDRYVESLEARLVELQVERPT